MRATSAMLAATPNSTSVVTVHVLAYNTYQTFYTLGPGAKDAL